ncbi:hypothetical protein NYE67_02625 [Solibacillus sp. FSL W8-0474]|uniref:hypothetical protein n=1 Tax=Solibacillus sp. FSL W8-0474 TaxID=2975336 RepID=UPI0030F51340
MAIIVTKPEIAHSSIRTKVNELLYCLQVDAQRNKAIEELLIEKDNAIRELYKFSFGTRSYEEGVPGSRSDPFYHVVNIIALKEWYEKRINRYRLKHERFHTILEHLPFGDKETLIRAFCTTLEVDEKDVKEVIRKHLKYIESVYKKYERDALKRSMELSDDIEGPSEVIVPKADEEKRKKRLAKIRKTLR